MLDSLLHDLQQQIHRINPDLAAASADSPRTRANRENAKKSTGPKSAAGKLKVSCNAWQHGLTGQKMLFEESEYLYYLELGRQYMADLLPSGGVELQLAQHIVDTNWLVLRATALELNLSETAMQKCVRSDRNPDPRTEAVAASADAYREDCGSVEAINKLGRHRTRLSSTLDKLYLHFLFVQDHRVTKRGAVRATPETCEALKWYDLAIEAYKADEESRRLATEAAKAAELKAAETAQAEAPAAVVQTPAEAGELIAKASTSELALFCEKAMNLIKMAVPPASEKEFLQKTPAPAAQKEAA